MTLVLNVLCFFSNHISETSVTTHQQQVQRDLSDEENRLANRASLASVAFVLLIIYFCNTSVSKNFDMPSTVALLSALGAFYFNATKVVVIGLIHKNHRIPAMFVMIMIFILVLLTMPPAQAGVWSRGAVVALYLGLSALMAVIYYKVATRFRIAD